LGAVFALLAAIYQTPYPYPIAYFKLRYVGADFYHMAYKLVAGHYWVNRNTPFVAGHMEI
jgi:hypothetical protein